MFKPNESITDTFAEAFGTTTYTNSDFVKSVYLNGAASAVTATVTHIASGVYKVAFTPNAVGLWVVSLYPSADSTVKYSQSYLVEAAELDSVVESEGSITAQEALSLTLAAVAGQTTTGGLRFLTPNGNATRIVAAVNSSNERTSITLTPSS